MDDRIYSYSGPRTFPRLVFREGKWRVMGLWDFRIDMYAARRAVAWARKMNQANQ